jgi:hypothetical protein
VASDCLTRRNGEGVKRLSKTEQEVDDDDYDHDDGNEDEPSLPCTRMVPGAALVRFEPRLFRRLFFFVRHPSVIVLYFIKNHVFQAKQA